MQFWPFGLHPHLISTHFRVQFLVQCRLLEAEPCTLPVSVPHGFPCVCRDLMMCGTVRLMPEPAQVHTVPWYLVSNPGVTRLTICTPVQMHLTLFQTWSWFPLVANQISGFVKIWGVRCDIGWLKWEVRRRGGGMALAGCPHMPSIFVSRPNVFSISILTKWNPKWKSVELVD